MARSDSTVTSKRAPVVPVLLLTMASRLLVPVRCSLVESLSTPLNGRLIVCPSKAILPGLTKTRWTNICRTGSRQSHAFLPNRSTAFPELSQHRHKKDGAQNAAFVKSLITLVNGG